MTTRAVGASAAMRANIAVSVRANSTSSGLTERITSFAPQTMEIRSGSRASAGPSWCAATSRLVTPAVAKFR